MTLVEAAKMAMVTLEHINPEDNDRGFLRPYQCTMLDNTLTALRTAIEQAEKQGPMAWFDNTGTLRGRVSDEQLDLLCRSAVTEISKRNGWSEEGPSLDAYKWLGGE